jgi:hypothetical protein
MKAKHILAFLSVFLITLAVTQSFVELSWKETTLMIYLKDVGHKIVSLFFSLLVAIPITMIIQKKYEKNDRK